MRSTRFQSQERFFHFASRIQSSAWHQLESAQQWTLLKFGLKQLGAQENVQWISAVLMGTHFHLLFGLTSPRENILMLDLEKLISEQLTAAAPVSSLFEYPILCEQILNLPQFRKTYKYIYRNPVEAGLCLRVQDYPWSSLRELLQAGADSLFVDGNSLIQNPYKTLRWLNIRDDDTGLQSSFLS